MDMSPETQAAIKAARVDRKRANSRAWHSNFESKGAPLPECLYILFCNFEAFPPDSRCWFMLFSPGFVLQIVGGHGQESRLPAKLPRQMMRRRQIRLKALSSSSRMRQALLHRPMLCTTLVGILPLGISWYLHILVCCFGHWVSSSCLTCSISMYLIFWLELLCCDCCSKFSSCPGSQVHGWWEWWYQGSPPSVDEFPGTCSDHGWPWRGPGVVFLVLMIWAPVVSTLGLCQMSNDSWCCEKKYAMGSLAVWLLSLGW